MLTAAAVPAQDAAGGAGGSWLSRLAALPCFASLGEGLAVTVKKALIVETDAVLVTDYLTQLRGSLKVRDDDDDSLVREAPCACQLRECCRLGAPP